MKLRISTSTNLAGSNKGSFMATPSVYCYGKGTTYDFYTTEYDSLADLIPALLFSATSPYLFRDGKRDRKSMVGVGNVLMVDIDAPTDITPQFFQSLLTMPFQYLVVPTQNHLTSIDTERRYFKYRLIVPITGVLNDQQYKSAVRWLVDTYNIGSVDSASYTDARFYAPTFPLAGQFFKQFVSKHEPVQSFTITDEMILPLYQRVGMLDEATNSLILPDSLYPKRLEGDVLEYHDTMAQHTTITTDSVASAEVSGRTMSEVYDDNDNNMSEDAFKRVFEKAQVALGDIASALRPDQRVFCKCPTSHNHTDQGDTRYSWLLKTGSGDTRLYCASDHCKKDYGEYRRIGLPKWRDFVAEENYGRTTARVEELTASILYSLVTKLAKYISGMHNTTFSNWYEEVDYAKKMLYSHYIDENALHCLVLLTVKEGKSPAMIYDISLAGGNKGLLNVKKAGILLQGGWYSYLFQDKWTELSDYAQDKEISKFKIVEGITETVAGDQAFVEIIKEHTILRPSLQYDSSITVDLSMEGRAMTFVNNSFDEPVYRLNKKLTRDGIPALPNYGDTLKAFLHHWRLPYGSVMFGENEIGDLPSLLILFSALNMYSDGEANQRHTAFVITAPSGIGKTALINNFMMAGLSNDDSHNAHVFGYEGLYPNSVDDLKSKLWATGDELSPRVMKNDISMGALLSNLTRSNVRVNIKGHIDSEFTAFSKVLWGAKAWDAISLGDQATELRNRLFALTYTAEMFDNDDGTPSYFLNMCELDNGTLDKIIQHWIGDRYIQIKEMVLSVPIEERLTLFTAFKNNVKAKYAGTLDYDTEYADDGTATTVVRTVASDETRSLVEVFKALLEYASRVQLATGDFPPVVFSPMNVANNYLDGDMLKILGGEELTHCSFRSKRVQPFLAIPRLQSTKGMDTWFIKVVEHMYPSDKSSKAYRLMQLFRGNEFRKALNSDAFAITDPVLLREMEYHIGNRDSRRKAKSMFEEELPSMKRYFDVSKYSSRGTKYYALPIDLIEKFIEDNSS